MFSQRIRVDSLTLYRATHYYQNPCCLCATPGGTIVESTIVVAKEGELCNAWVATCAFDACGYLGKCFLFCYISHN